MNSLPNIRIAHSRAADARTAVHEFHAAVDQPDIALVMFFCSSNYDLDALAAEMRGAFPGVTVVGCTTAGEIGPAGYTSHSLAGASLPAGSFHTVVERLDDLQHFEIARGQQFVQSLLQRLEAAGTADPERCFAFLMIDGLSMREEPVARALQHALGRITLFGGSAGDDLKFERTWVYHDGAFRSDSAILVIASTRYTFRIFKTQHFTSNAERVVVTEADPARRIVKELNGLPAAEEYARLIGTTADELGPDVFAAAPVVVVIDGSDYVRSIQKANPDGSLTFYCAIEEGLVLRVAHGRDVVSNLADTFAELRDEIGPLQAVFACDCILRNREIAKIGVVGEIGDILRANNAVGFSTYGEQFRGMHINQTITGIAIGSATGEEP